VEAALTGIGKAIRHDRELLAAAVDGIERARARYAEITDGGLNPLIAQALGGFGAAAQAARDAIGQLDVADEHVADYLAVVCGRDVVRVPREQAPGPKTAFTYRTDLDPHTEYVVAGRGRFLTGGEGRVIRVRTRSGKKGAWNPELTSPVPNAHYIVDDRYEFHTDQHGRTTRMTTDRLGFDPRINTDDRRNTSQQAQVGREGGPGYEGGHLAGTKHLGPGERINLIPMLEQVNRGAGDSFARLEEKWRARLARDPSAKIEVDIRAHYSGATTVPDRIVVRYSIDGIERRKVFENVR
jgi:DNA/RNA non-specific endonuclease